LRQTILNLAVRGKLVPQKATEGTGKDLVSSLKNVRAESEAIGKVRRQNSALALTEEEKWAEVPDTWAWARLVEVGQTQTGTSPSSANPTLFGDFIPFVKPADLDGHNINYDGPGLSQGGVEHSRLAPANSVLMVCIGATLGKVNRTTRPVCFNQQINSITPFLDGLADYVSIALKASAFQDLAWSKAGTGTLPIISKGKWEILPIPLPPLAEQHRIVFKVNELMGLCDRLEASLTTGDDTRRRLLEALLAEALTPQDGLDREAAE
jgi:type I restriction enzyme S subunit